MAELHSVVLRLHSFGFWCPVTFAKAPQLFVLLAILQHGTHTAPQNIFFPCPPIWGRSHHVASTKNQFTSYQR